MPQILENDIIRMMSALVLQIFLSYPLQSLPVRSRSLYSLTTGTLLQLFVYGP